MFTRILIANRGEIAIRIIRACKEMGIFTVAVYSEADKESLHVALADLAICIGKAPASESYLDKKRIISAALATKAQAIHPGYGFLSENADFAKMCERHGICFIGPNSDIISKMGDKDTARRVMKENGVPTTPGSDILKDFEEAKIAAEKIGYPILLKASAGGGGKGIRLVTNPEGMEKEFKTASNEAQKAFGDGRMYLEKFLSPVKHIEVQLLADEKGTVVCLGERECSIQKNNQKLIEESPSSAVDDKTREKLIEAATKAAKAVGYMNAGTVEFLMDTAGNFYFMEMNTRLQVEHPVSELVTGIDIVKWQIRIAAGVPLDFTQKDIEVKGAAIECRINALSAGKINFFIMPGGPWVRFDTFVYQGYDVPPYYDSMLGKLIVYSSTREEAIRKMQSALCELVVDGTKNNIESQIAIVRDPDFKSGNYFTDFMKNRS
ncbi:acetyl-CoA carboxylase biotin carboxylase subunit [Scatolibacter rhodanostii]|uniref:acetyl-CoA carboxylase biotin carboxylase subunit n=1 Tax=Scatolibacter rhodanostii TaxID=2014781 RepID=UPI000C07D31B|nr:acetyl-CoA carboxylase biotin carboxylase subunit [Scatolibacter rhodanostii]